MHWMRFGSRLFSTKHRTGKRRGKNAMRLLPYTDPDLRSYIKPRLVPLNAQTNYSGISLLGLTKIPAWKPFQVQVSSKPICLHKQLLFSESSENSSVTEFSPVPERRVSSWKSCLSCFWHTASTNLTLEGTLSVIKNLLHDATSLHFFISVNKLPNLIPNYQPKENVKDFKSIQTHY